MEHFWILIVDAAQYTGRAWSVILSGTLDQGGGTIRESSNLCASSTPFMAFNLGAQFDDHAVPHCRSGSGHDLS